MDGGNCGEKTPPSNAVWSGVPLAAFFPPDRPEVVGFFREENRAITPVPLLDDR